MSVVELLNSRLYSIYDYRLDYCYRLSYSHRRFRNPNQKPSNFIRNLSTFPLLNSCCCKVSFSRNLESFDLWRGYFKDRRWRDRESRIRANASCEHDSESKTSAPEKTEANTGSNSKQASRNSVNSMPASPASSTSSQRREKQGKSWFRGRKWRWQPLIQAREIGVFLLQLGIAMFVMRLLRPGIPLPGLEPRPPTTFVSVPYSEFLNKIGSNQVQKVEVDGVHIMFRLKNEGFRDSVGDSEVVGSSGSSVSQFQDSDSSLLGSVSPTKRIVHTTTRPTDIKTPYEKMLENGVEFGSPDERSGGFLNSALVGFSE
ncbi:hypothetical protein Ancab_011492 [Ancistrocladus abbreviatus]